TGSEAGEYMVVGPDWKGVIPPGIKKVFRSSTQFSVAGYRTQLFNPDDLDNVKKVQAGYKAKMLSAYLNQPPPSPAPAIDFPKIDKELVKTNFFEYLDFALQFAPAQENEKEILAQLASIGVPPGQQPPVNSFWSLTMYDGKTQFLIENPINRYLINSPMLPGMKTNADGSLTLYIQNKSPGADKAANWLPAPNGPIYLVMRLYW